MSDEVDPLAEYEAYLHRPALEASIRRAAAEDILNGMHQRKGQVVGITRIAGTLGQLDWLLEQGDITAARDYITGVVVGAAEVVSQLQRETSQLSRQVSELAGSGG